MECRAPRGASSLALRGIDIGVTQQVSFLNRFSGVGAGWLVFPPHGSTPSPSLKEAGAASFPSHLLASHTPLWGRGSGGVSVSSRKGGGSQTSIESWVLGRVEREPPPPPPCSGPHPLSPADSRPAPYAPGLSTHLRRSPTPVRGRERCRKSQGTHRAYSWVQGAPPRRRLLAPGPECAGRGAPWGPVAFPHDPLGCTQGLRRVKGDFQKQNAKPSPLPNHAWRDWLSCNPELLSEPTGLHPAPAPATKPRPRPGGPPAPPPRSRPGAGAGPAGGWPY